MNMVKTCIAPFAALVVFAGFSPCASADVLEVGEGKAYADLATAVGDAKDHDTVLVYEGTYTLASQLEITGAITLKSDAGAEATVIQREGVIGTATDCQRVLYLDNTEALVDGFTISGGYNGSQDMTAAVIGGSGVYIGKGGSLANCVITGNYGNCVIGGGLCINGSAGTVVSNCVITGNNCESGIGKKGGHKCNAAGVYVKGATQGEILIVDTEISHNDSYAGNESHGIGVNVQNGNICFLRCKITDNVAQARPAGYSYSEGSGVDLKNSSAWKPTFISCLIAGNGATTYRSGGVYGSSGLFLNCTIVGNMSTVGGGVNVSTADIKFRNCIIQDNVTAGDESEGAPEWVVGAGCTPFTHCLCPKALPSASAEDGNVTGSATFVPGTYELQGGSVGFDTGDLTGYEDIVGATDLNGDDRVWGQRIDIGCYEYSSAGLDVHAVATPQVVDKGGKSVLSASVINPAGLPCLYKWELNGEVVSTEASFEKTFDAAGEYAYNLTVTAAGGDYTDAVVVKVSPSCVYVVDANRHPGHEPRLPCDTPDTAFTNIQEAVDYLPPGKTVYVDEGEYAVTSNVSVTKDINVISLKGPAATTIVRHPSVKSRLLYVSSPNAMVSGFTFKNGWLNVRNNDGSGGGVYIDANGGTVSNCAVTGCYINSDMYIYGGGVRMASGTLVDCRVCFNTNFYTLANLSDATIGNGGGVYISKGSIVRCEITDNLLKASASETKFATRYGGGAFVAGSDVRIVNSLIARNRSEGLGGGLFVQGTAIVSNCTVTANESAYGGGIFCAKKNTGSWAIFTGPVVNTAVVGNSASIEDDNIIHDDATIPNMTYCFGPEGELPEGEGNVFGTDAKFSNAVRGDYRPRQASSLVDNGVNAAWMETATDLRGHSRIINKRVDIGCYEFPWRGFSLLVR